MPIDREELRSALTRKGFRKREGDHEKYILYVDGRKSGIWTKISRGSDYKSIGDVRVSDIAKQMGLAKAELVSFVDCELSDVTYLELVKARGRLILS